MDETDVNPYGPERPPHSRRPLGRTSRIAIGVGLAAFCGMAGTGVAFAVSGTSNPSSTPAASSSSSSSVSGRAHGGGFRAFGGFAGGRMFGPPGNVLHGEYTVAKPTAGDEVLYEQQGVVSAVSSTSIAVKSADGYSATYSVSPTTIVDSEAGGISAVSPKDTVRISAESAPGASGPAAATDITDTTKIGSSRQGFGLGPGPGGPPAGASGRPAAPA